MKRLCALIFLLLVFPSQAMAAKCKVDGQWYPYDSPECSANARGKGADSVPDSNEPEAIFPAEPTTQAYSPGKTAAAYAKPWREVNYLIEKQCEQYGSQPLGAEHCRIREERGYWSMQSSFGLPEPVAREAKEFCAAGSDAFSRQFQCLESETMGYFMFMLDYAMPANYHGEAQAKCLREHTTYAKRGSCMFEEEAAFAEKYGHQFYQPQKRGRHVTYPQKPRVMPLSGSGRGASWVDTVGEFVADPQNRPAVQTAAHPAEPPSPIPMATVGHQLGIFPEDLGGGPFTIEQGDVMAATMRESTDRFSLSLQAPEAPNRGFFELVAPSTVDARRGAFFAPGSAGQVVLHLALEQGRTYLIDFAVNSGEGAGARYRVTAESGEQVYLLTKNPCCHVVAKLKASSLGWTQVALTQDTGKGFYWRSIDVTLTPRSEWTPQSVPADGKRKR